MGGGGQLSGRLGTARLAAYLIGTALAVLCTVAAYFWAEGATARFALFWVGMIVLLISSAFFLMPSPLRRGVAVAAVGLAGVISYLPELFRSYARPARYDEVLHMGQVHLLLAGTWLGHNSVDRTIGLYPLYQMLVVAVHYLTWLSLWHSDLLVAGAGHVVTVLAIYWLAKELTARPRVAVAAALLFIAGPAVLFALSEAAYESVGLPLALLTCLLALSAGRRGGKLRYGGFLVLAALTVITQPVSGLFLAAFLLLLGAMSFRLETGYGVIGQSRVPKLLGLGLVAVVLNLGWIAAVGWNTVWNYVLPSGNLLREAISAIEHLGHNRSFYHGSGLPAYERVTGLVAIFLLPLLVVFAFVLYRRGKLAIEGDRGRLIARTSFAMALVFVLSYGLILNPTLGFIWVHRSWELLWVGVAIVLGYLADSRSVLSRHFSGVWLSIALVVLFLGFSAVTTPSDYMFSGKYRFGSSVDLLTPGQLQAAHWLKVHAPGAKITSDSDTEDVDWAYGQAEVVRFPTWTLTFSSQPIRPAVRYRAEHDGVQYLVVDKLMYHEASSGIYIYASGEPNKYGRGPLPISFYDKLLHTSWLKLVYSNSQMSIFRLKR